MKSAKSTSAQFRPDHLGTQPVESRSNKGKQMNTKSNEQPDYVPPKG
ncbi:acid-soluble spore protein N [Alkalihalobacillus oceani]|nr:acid-soluble spore protein N [Halalkalibacter oceani]